jgi:outer membrane protein assembly factor BamB
MGDAPKTWVVAVLGVLLFDSTAIRVRADDWPQWLGPKRDGVWRESGILDQFPQGGPIVKWRAKIAAGYSGPAVANGRVYVTDRVLAEGAKNPDEKMPSRQKTAIPGIERVLCLSEKDGSLLWKHEYDCPYKVSYPLGPRTTPVVADGKVYTLGAEGNLLCLDVEKGKVVWERNLKKDYKVESPMWGFSAHPLLDGQKLICIVGGEGTTVVAFDKNSGKELWRALTAREPGYCPPMIYEIAGKRQLIIWHPQAVNGVDPETGKVYWTQPTNSYFGMTIATPRLVGKDAIFVSGHPQTSVLVRVKDGTTPELAGWKGSSKLGIGSVFSTPFVEEGHIYGVHSGGALSCIKPETGERLWESFDATTGDRPAGSAECFLIKNGDRFFLFNEKGDLIIAQLSPKGYKEISRAHLLDPTTSTWGRDVLWSHPAFANRCVFARNDKELVCVSLAAN